MKLCSGARVPTDRAIQLRRLVEGGMFLRGQVVERKGPAAAAAVAVAVLRQKSVKQAKTNLDLGTGLVLWRPQAGLVAEAS